MVQDIDIEAELKEILARNENVFKGTTQQCTTQLHFASVKILI